MRGAGWSRRSKDADRQAKQLDRLLGRAEELLDRGDEDELVEVLATLPPHPWVEASFHVRAGDLHSELGTLEQAEKNYRAALAIDARCSDALHGLGLVHALRGEYDDMIDAWLAVRALDLRDPPAPWALTLDEFSNVAEKAFEEIPEHIRSKLENLPIVVHDYPSEDLIREGIDPRTLGLITGIPYSQKAGDSGVALDCVQLYQRNIERLATSREEVEDEIRITVLHETGHYFGLDDDDLDDIGLG